MRGKGRNERLLADPETVAQDDSPIELNTLLAIAAFETDKDAPGPVLARRERSSPVSLREREAITMRRRRPTDDAWRVL